MVFLLIVSAILLGVFIFKTHKDYVILACAKRIKQVNGEDIGTIAPIAPGRSIFGNNLDLIAMNGEGMFAYFRKMTANLGKSYVQYFFRLPCYNVITAPDAELIFNDKRLITKGMLYTFTVPFIQLGLLTSTGAKWHSRRKLLSPAFHFNILESFLEIFKAEGQKFVNALKNSDGDEISLTKLIPRVTLNVICETALGVKLDEMKDGDKYREHMNNIERGQVKRMSNPMYQSDFLWKYLGNGKEYQTSYDGVHRFSSEIIKKRRVMFAELENQKKTATAIENEDDIFMSKKQKYAMLDTLLIAEGEGRIDHAGICEEVDTFVFEGFDTTSMGLIYAVMNLSLYPEMQQKCYEEILSFIDDDLTTLTISQVSKLEYLDRFLKETLRMFPSVPVIARQAEHEVVLSNNIVLPKGSQVNIHLYDILRDPKQFENPGKFDPDRFLQDNASGRHPFAYVPFSAGFRNCIGQKMAMLEMKSLLVFVLKNYEIFQVGNPQNFTYNQGFLLRVTQEVKVRISKRI